MKNYTCLALGYLLAITVSFAACQQSPPKPHATKVELSEATSKDLVQVTGSGDGLESINVTLQSKSNDPLEVTVQPGTIFEALSGGTQSMVTREERSVTLESSGSTQSLTIDAACANMHLNMPGEGDRFSIRKTPPSDDLKKLVTVPGFHSEPFRVQQFAIWTITDNPDRSGYVEIGETDFGSGPGEEEIQKIRVLFGKAGISTEKYRALR